MKLLNHTFFSEHQVQFYETDLMGIVHHSNYLRFFEEARVAWAHSVGLIDYQVPSSASKFAVLETAVRHLAPSFFGDRLRIYVQARASGRARIEFGYEIVKANDNQKLILIATGKTEHVALDSKLQPQRRPQAMQDILEKQKWIEI